MRPVSTGGRRRSGSDDQTAEPAASRRIVCRWNIRRYVKDEELRRKLIPNYRAGCKRILNSWTYYGAVANPKAELITDRIARITADGIVTADGVRPGGRHRLRHRLPYHRLLHLRQIKGPRGEDLVDRWNREGVGAHRGIAVAEMPNLFFLLGPNTGLGHNAVVFMIESQIRYVGRGDRRGAQIRRPGVGAQPVAQDKFNAELQTS